MADLDFGDGTWEDARGTIQNNITELVGIVKGNGREGLKTTLDKFITEYRTDQIFHQKRDQEIKDAIAEAAKKKETADNSKDREINRKLTIAALIVALFMAYMAVRDFQRKTRSLEMPPGVTYQQPQQSTTLPDKAY